MPTHNYKIGDLVRLKSGGPLMTIWRVEGDDIDVVMFDDQVPKYFSFGPAVLMREPAPKPD